MRGLSLITIASALAIGLAACSAPPATPTPTPGPPQLEVIVENASPTASRVQVQVSAELKLAGSTAQPCNAVAVRSRTPGTWEILVAGETILTSDAPGLPVPTIGQALRVVISISPSGSASVDQTTSVAMGDSITTGSDLDPFRPAPSDCAS